MKNLLVLAIALASTEAMASRARVQSLGGAAHITDTQNIYDNPAYMFSFGDFVNLETGATTTTTTNANAEGLLVRSLGDAKLGFSLGHKSSNAAVAGLRAIAGAAAREQQNPVEVSYGQKMGDISYAGTLVYSNYNDKKNEVKESSLGFRLGAVGSNWEAYLKQGLANTINDKVNNIDYKGTAGTTLFGAYRMDTMYMYGSLSMSGAKSETQTGTELTKLDRTTITAGVVDSHKKDGNEFFYGASLMSQTTKDKNVSIATKEAKTTEMTLPVIVGFEAEATSWLALRASLTQNVLIHDSKTENETDSTTASEKAPGANSTVAAVGAGLKFNKITIDGSLETLTGSTATQKLNGTNLLAQVGLTYMF